MKEYWYCMIGPIERDKVPSGGDFLLRQAAKTYFEKTTGEEADTCSSGWGVTEDEYRQIMDLKHELFKKRNK